MASTRRRNGSWHVRYRDLDGNLREMRAGKTESEAEQLKVRVEEWLADGICPSRASATLGQVTEAFFRDYLIPRCRYGTVRDYQSAFEKYFLPLWESVPMRRVTKAAMKRTLAEIQSAGEISNKRVNNIAVPLKRLWSWSVEEGYATTNNALGLKPYPTEHPEMMYLTSNEIHLLAEACDYHDGFYRPHILTLGWTGLRFGELRELRFSDCELDNLQRPMVHVQRAVQNGKEIVGAPKSGKDRWIGLPPHIADLLRTQRERLCASDGDLVFPSHNGNRLDPSDFRSRVFKPTLVKAGLALPQVKSEPRVPTVRIHDLRHSFARIFLVEGKGDIYGLKEAMGHADVKTTMRYAHFSKGDAARAADTLAAAWQRNQEDAKGDLEESSESV